MLDNYIPSDIKQSDLEIKLPNPIVDDWGIRQPMLYVKNIPGHEGVEHKHYNWEINHNYWDD